MSHFKLKINGEIIFDGDVGTWLQKPPSFIEEHLKPGSTPEQYMKPVMLIFTESIMTNVGTSITVTHNKKQWTMVVEKL